MDLPNDIKKLIIQHSDDKSRRHLRVTNTAWFNLVHYDQFKVYFATPLLLPTIIDRLSQYQWQIGLTFLKTINLTSKHVKEHLFKLTQLTSFACHNNLMAPNDSTKWLDLTILTNLQHVSFESKPIPEDLIYYYSNLTSISGAQIINVKNTRENLFSYCTKLEHLALSALIPPETNPPKIDQLHRLTYLYVNTSSLVLDVTKMTNLRYLGAPFVPGANIGNLTTLEALVVGKKIVGDISANKNLTHLSLELPHNAQHTTVLKSLTSLKMLTLELISIFNANINVDNNQVLLSIPQSVTYLSVEVAGDFNIKNISHLTNLRTLELVSQNELQYEVTAEDFKPFSHLTHLSAGEQFAAVKYLPELRYFSTWDYFSLNDGSTMDEFDPTLVPKLEVLSFSKSIPARVFNRLTALRSLKTLMIYEEPHEEFDYNVLTYMDLEALHMSPAKMTRAGWLALQKLTKLNTLAISTKEVTEDLTLLTSLTRLTRLFVGNAKLEHYLPFTFLQLLSCHPRLTISRQLLDQNFPYLACHNFSVEN